MMKKSLAIGLIAPALLLGALPASAAEIISDYEFDVTTSGPIPSHSGTFSLGFDDDTGVYSLKAINFAIGTTSFNLANTGVTAMSGGFAIFGLLNGSTIVSNTNDFFLGNYVGDFFGYTTVGFNEVGLAGQFYGTGSVKITNLSSAVPEPSTWLMLILGFAAVSASMRRRKPVVRTTVSYA